MCVYWTTDYENKHKFMLLDFEGGYGGVPRRLRSKLGFIKELGAIVNLHVSNIYIGLKESCREG